MAVLNCITYFIKKLPRQFKDNNREKNIIRYFYTQFETRNGNVTSNEGYCNRLVRPCAR